MFKKSQCSPVNVKKILFITLSNIGDVILTTPTIEAIHLKYPNAVIDIVGDARSRIIFRHCPYMGKFYEKKKQAGWLGIIALLRILRRTNYDIAIDLRSDGLLYLIKAKFKFFKLLNKSTLSIHSVEKHFFSLKEIVNPTIPNLKIWLSKKEKMKANKLLKEFKTKKILALGLGANYDGKIWPTSSFLELANQLKKYFDLILLLGSNEDKKRSSFFIKNYSGAVIDCAGIYSILETTALLERSTFFVGNDSGLGHMASAADIPSFTVFGIGEPFRYRPWGNKALWHQDSNNNIGDISGSFVANVIIKQLKLN